MAKAKKVIDVSPMYIPPKSEFYFYVGEKYYRRLQPVPYKYSNPSTKKLKKYLESII
jgi:hypothetical protein